MDIFFKKIIVAVLSFCIILTCITGCMDNEENQIDNTKSQLYIGNLYAGFRDGWLQQWKKDFETMYAETTFEVGKKGVQVWVDNQRDAYSGNTLLSSISAYSQDIYFTEEAYLYDFLSRGACADITDIVTQNLSEVYEGESKSISNKMVSDLKDFYCVNGKYYMLPIYEAYFGIIYDKDLFKEKSFYISNETTDTSVKFTNNINKFSAGIDGVVGTDDDGLPTTYEQFYSLLAKMKGSNVTPFIWTGKYHTTYGNRFVEALSVDSAGKEESKMNFSLQGTSSTLVDSINDSSKLYKGVSYDTSSVTLKPTTAINENNAVELQKQASKFYATQFTSNIIKDETNYDLQSFGSLSQTATQAEYLYSYYNYNTNPIALLLDGTWWRAEAKSTFDNMVQSYGEEASIKSRNFGLMPMPKANKNMLGESTYYAQNDATVFVSKYCPESKLNLAKKFVQFCFTNKSLQNYTKDTDTTMPYDYGFATDNEEKEFTNTLTSYGKSMWNIHKSGNIVYGFSSNQKFIQNYSYFSKEWKFATKLSSGKYQYLFSTFHDNTALTAKDYFLGLYNYHCDSNLWQNQ